MESRFRFVRAAVAAVCIGVLGGACPGVVLAGPANKTSSVTLGPDTFKVPTTPDYRTGRLAPADDKPVARSFPDRIDLGGSALRLDTNRDALTPAPRGGLDETDQSVLNPGIRTRKDSPLQPSYFGLTLTTPTH